MKYTNRPGGGAKAVESSGAFCLGPLYTMSPISALMELGTECSPRLRSQAIVRSGHCSISEQVFSLYRARGSRFSLQRHTISDLATGHRHYQSSETGGLLKAASCSIVNKDPNNSLDRKKKLQRKQQRNFNEAAAFCFFSLKLPCGPCEPG